MASTWALALERSGLLRAILRHRWVIVLVASVGAALLEVHTTGPSSDGPYFAHAGRELVSRNGLHVYAAPGLQAGPLQVGAFGLLSRLTGSLHLAEDPTYAVISTLASTVLLVAGVRTLRRHVGLPSSATAELLVGVLSVGWLMATEVYTSGHPAELVIPALWIAAAVLATEDRAVLAGALIGVGAGFETWAVLGVPVLLLSGRLLPAGRAAMAMVGTAAAMYLPFVIAGPFRMGQAVWTVSSASLIHAIDPRLVTFPWSARLAQSVVVVAMGTVAWWVTRRTGAGAVMAVWFVPAVLALVKAISEPSGYDWYWLPVQVVVLAGCACADGLPRRVVAALLATEAVAVTASLRSWPLALVALAGLIVAGWWHPAAGRSPSIGRVPTGSRAA
jgi:hypothetical protein